MGWSTRDKQKEPRSYYVEYLEKSLQGGEIWAETWMTKSQLHKNLGGGSWTWETASAKAWRWGGGGRTSRGGSGVEKLQEHLKSGGQGEMVQEEVGVAKGQFTKDAAGQGKE